MSTRVVLAGGSGFLGRALARELVDAGREVVILTRAPCAGTAAVGGIAPASHGGAMSVREIAWDGEHVGAWCAELDGAAALVNLAGRSVDCRYTAANRREIVDSRVNSVRALGAAIRATRTPPRVWVQAGSLAIYGDAGDRVCDEAAPHGEGFSVEVCQQWERALAQETLPGTRRVNLRIGFVLGRDAGALGRLLPLARYGLGGHVGSGEQYISWLHLDDMTAIFRLALERAELAGTYNATAPTPVPNREFMRALRTAVGRGFGLPTPAAAVHFGSFLMRTEPSLALTGRRCVPARLVQQGFSFRHTELARALADVVA